MRYALCDLGGLMADNTNTVKITLQFSDDGTVKIIDQAKGKVDDLGETTRNAFGKAQKSADDYLKYWTRSTSEIDRAYQKIREGYRSIYLQSLP